jgi:hypothetical protein
VFSKEEAQKARKHMKKCTPSLATKKLQIKTKIIFYLTSVRIASKNNTINSTIMDSNDNEADEIAKNFIEQILLDIKAQINSIKINTE